LGVGGWLCLRPHHSPPKAPICASILIL